MIFVNRYILMFLLHHLQTFPTVIFDILGSVLAVLEEDANVCWCFLHNSFITNDINHLFIGSEFILFTGSQMKNIHYILLLALAVQLCSGARFDIVSVSTCTK